MKGIRKKLAAVLAVALIATSFSLSGLAAVGSKQWVLNEDGTWNLWKNGEMVKNEMITETKDGVEKTFYLKEDGVMASNETFTVYDTVDGRDVEYTCYALPSGELAKKRWVQLNNEGVLDSFSQENNWYFFSENGKRSENTLKQISEKYSGTVKKIMYYFDEEGKMTSENFIDWELENGETVRYYFQHDGARAEDKWLKVDGDWYSFKSNGACKTASDSNAEYAFNEEGQLISEQAPFRDVDSLALHGAEERTAKVGDKINITYDVQLASDSNATVQKVTDDHDYWVEVSDESTLLNAYDRTYNLKDGKINITVIPRVPTTIEVMAVMDGVKSTPVTITSGWGENADIKKADAMVNVLSSDDVGNAVATIKELSKETEDSTSVKKAWLDNVSSVKTMDDSYAMMNGNIVSQETMEAAKTLLGSGEVKLIGGSLNADRGDRVTLTVDVGETAELPETFEKQVSFGLNFYIGDAKTSQLEIPVIVKMPIPEGMSREGLKVYHIADDGTAELLDAKVGETEVTFATDRFSDYVFAGKASGGSIPDPDPTPDPTPDSKPDSGSGSSTSAVTSKKSAIPETPGSWKKADSGKWQFATADGTLYQNTWIYVKGQWYWIDATGFMAEGWQDINGKWYYMASGGAMLSNTKTPDGYQVDGMGVWVK